MGPVAEQSGSGCPNCGHAPVGRYCPRCGQDQRPDRTVRALIGDLLDGLLEWDSRLWRTLRVLVTRPGELSLEHVRGRRARYLPPVRLYLVSSVLFFTMVELAPSRIVTIDTTPSVTEEESPSGADRAAGAPAQEGSGATVGTRVKAAFARAAAEQERLNELFVRSLAWTMFVLIPVFALLLRLLFRDRELLYVQHVVFALHYHAFAFATQSAGLGATHVDLWGATGDATAVLLPQMANAGYLVVSTKRFYGRDWAATLGRVVALGCAYALVLSAGIALTLVAIVLLFWSA